MASLTQVATVNGGRAVGATILVADDEAPIVEVVAALLEDEGHTVLRAFDGQQALARLEADGFDLLITDNMMPRVSGLDLIRRMIERPELAVPTILMSAVRPMILPLPPIVFLPKPFDINHLLAVVTRLLHPARKGH